MPTSSVDVYAVLVVLVIIVVMLGMIGRQLIDVWKVLREIHRALERAETDRRLSGCRRG